MSMRDRVSEGEDFVVEQRSRIEGSTSKEALKVDGTTGQVLREGQPVLAGQPLKTFILAGGSAAGDLTATGVAVGDKIAAAVNLTDASDGISAFDVTIAKANKIHQSSASDLSTKTFLFIVVSQA